MTTRQAGGIALVLVVIAVFLMVLFQTVELIQGRSALSERHDAQESALQDGSKLRRQFDTIVAEITELAATGDAGAKTVIDTLRRQGVVLSPQKP